MAARPGPPAEVLDPLSVAGRFALAGRAESAQPLARGHINDTFVIACPQRRYVLQRINRAVFKNPGSQMLNVARVCQHLRLKVPDPRRRLELVPPRGGGLLHRDPSGGCWRMYLYIEGSISVDVLEDPRQAREAGRAFGRFQAQLSDLPAASLRETLPDFHDTPRRLEALERAAREDGAGRARGAAAEIAFARDHAAWAPLLEDLRRSGAAPVRAVHNDTKINNVLFDASTGEALAVVDLDTVMPGLSLYDFGDLVRSCVSPAPEDEADLSQVRVRPEVFGALAAGYLEEAGAMLTPFERANLAVSPKVITYELGLRFLTDHLDGDIYFKIREPGHNLRRCRAQFHLAGALDRLSPELDLLVRGAQAR